MRRMAGIPVLLVLLAAGCGSLSSTTPRRSAQEQLLISTAADRALSKIGLTAVDGRRVFLDESYMDAYDGEYVTGKVRNAISFFGGRLVNNTAEAEVIVELRCGGQSINESTFLLGVPEIPLILLGSGYVIPEIPFFKYERQTSISKLSLFGYRADDGSILFSSGEAFGSSKATSYWIALIGPITFDDLPKLPPETSGYVYPLREPPLDEAAQQP